MVKMQTLTERPGARTAYPPERQVAALCWRKEKGRKEVLLITSRDTGRWIVPKGWPIKRLSDVQSALREAWEEAGVRAEADHARPAGQFFYDKALEDGSVIPIVAHLYKVRLRDGDLAAQYPEAGQRKRVWVPAKKAAKMVQEPELSKILRSL
ncbi:8-oxo-dGTP pyrophosphatase MutT (NUDIX family) [Roseovarius sp. MBR-78]|uniref:NUDIX hydrolase n=1 Tax=Roseovarius sp. MBR-78 TaxID=3156460 RepID=UPI0033974771